MQIPKFSLSLLKENSSIKQLTIINLIKIMSTIGDALSDAQKATLKRVKTENPVVKTPSGEKPFLRKRIPIADKIPFLIHKYGESTVKLALMIKNNAEFRRMISIAIKSNLKKNGEITDEDKVYITYFWNKFSVKVNGLSREYPFTTPLFINNFIAAIVMLSHYAQTISSNFCNEVNISPDIDYANNILDNVVIKDSEEVPEETEE